MGRRKARQTVALSKAMTIGFNGKPGALPNLLQNPKGRRGERGLAWPAGVDPELSTCAKADAQTTRLH